MCVCVFLIDKIWCLSQADVWRWNKRKVVIKKIKIWKVEGRRKAVGRKIGIDRLHEKKPKARTTTPEHTQFADKTFNLNASPIPPWAQQTRRRACRQESQPVKWTSEVLDGIPQRFGHPLFDAWPWGRSSKPWAHILHHWPCDTCEGKWDRTQSSEHKSGRAMNQHKGRKHLLQSRCRHNLPESAQTWRPNHGQHCQTVAKPPDASLHLQRGSPQSLVLMQLPNVPMSCPCDHHGFPKCLILPPSWSTPHFLYFL